MKESKTKDPELFKYTLEFQELKMTPELLQSISEGIKESRNQHIEAYWKEFGFKDFRGNSWKYLIIIIILNCMSKN